MKFFTSSLLLLFILTTSCNSQNKTDKLDKDTSIFYLIRHAEKDRSDKTNRNPNLIEKGKQRAENWAKHLKT